MIGLALSLFRGNKIIGIAILIIGLASVFGVYSCKKKADYKKLVIHNTKKLEAKKESKKDKIDIYEETLKKKPVVDIDKVKKIELEELKILQKEAIRRLELGISR